MNGMQLSEQPDFETSGDREKKKNKKEFIFVCCFLGICVLAFIALVIALVYLGYMRWTEFSLKSVDLSSSVVYEIDNRNIRDIKVAQFYGDIQFEKERLVYFNLENFEIDKRATTTLKIALTNVNIPTELTKHCMKNKEFEAAVNLYINWPRFFWIKYPYESYLNVKLPCSQITQVNTQKNATNIEV